MRKSSVPVADDNAFWRRAGLFLFCILIIVVHVLMLWLVVKHRPYKPGSIFTQTNPQSSARSPLRNRIFFVLWMATLFSNIGTWMNDVGAGMADDKSES